MRDKDVSIKTGHEQEGAHSTHARGDESVTRQKTFSRRALLEAGWTVPLIAAVQFPTDAFAVSVPAHNDEPPF